MNKINRKEVIQRLVKDVIDIRDLSDAITNFIKIIENLHENVVDDFDRIVFNLSKTNVKLRAIYLFYIINSVKLSKAKSISDATDIINDLLEKNPMGVDYDVYVQNLEDCVYKVKNAKNLKDMLIEFYALMDNSVFLNPVFFFYKKHDSVIHNLVFLSYIISNKFDSDKYTKDEFEIVIEKFIKDNCLTLNNLEDFLA